MAALRNVEPIPSSTAIALAFIQTALGLMLQQSKLPQFQTSNTLKQEILKAQLYC